MPELWFPGTLRVPLGDPAPTEHNYPAKAIAHITWDRNATPQAPLPKVPFEGLVSYFANDGAGMAPHIVWDPFTGRTAQFYPADSRSKSVQNEHDGKLTNRMGRVVIQVEAVFFPYCIYDGHPYAMLIDTPCKGWDRLCDWISSWGVSEYWPMGHPMDFQSHRNEDVWETQGGWYGHNQVPDNDHVDPGSWPLFPPNPPLYQSFPGRDFFHVGQKSPIIAAMHHRLVDEGCGLYKTNRFIDEWDEVDRESYQEWQLRLGYMGSDADGYPGAISWDALHVPKVV